MEGFKHKGLNEAHQVYKLLPISSGQFRLLELDPAPFSSSRVVARMVVRSLNLPLTDYVALSYSWGEATETDVIEVEGMNFTVTKNLRSALQHLRHERHKTVIWVDSVCIDQSSTVERNAQVAKMGVIYSQAEAVRIWLGDESEASQIAVFLVNDCEALAEDAIVRRIASDGVGAKALTDLLQRPYWKRMWVFQEIVLSRRATVHCGSLMAHWDTFKRLDRITGQPSLWSGLGARQGWILHLRRAFFRMSQFCIQKTDAQHIINVLQPTRDLQSTDPRDKLYALLGVCDSASLPAPDYSKTTREVYIEFTRSFIALDGDLSVLLTAGPWDPDVGEDLSLPSWTPDFRGRGKTDIRYVAASYLGYFDASKGTRIPIPLSLQVVPYASIGALITRGIILDTIKKSVFLGKGEERRMSILRYLDPQHLGPHPTGKSQFEILFQTMIFENATYHNGTTAQARQIQQENLFRLGLGFFHELKLFYQRGLSTTGATLDVLKLSEVHRMTNMEAIIKEHTRIELTDPEELHWRREEYLSRVEEATDGSVTSIFSTSSHYLGRGSTTIQEGDVVAILFGCKLPVVLRKSQLQSGYQFISPCYVSGVMNGEIIEKLNTDGSNSQLIIEVLRLI